jgi:hypothetical protein
MWVFWAFVVLVVAVVLGVVLYAALTVERMPGHGSRPLTAIEKLRRFIKHQPPGQPLSRRRQALKDARRAEWSARLTRVKGLLRRPERPVEDVQLPPLVADATPEEPEEPAEPEPAATPEDEQIDLTESPTDEDWAATLRQQVKDEAVPGPNDHLARTWPDRTGEWPAGMIARMTEDGQMPPPDPSAEPGTPADAFMGGAESS